MTFQEAIAVIYADQGAHDNEMMQKAIDTVKFFEDNVLELEDYETDQLYKAVDYINNNKLGEIEMTNEQTVNVEELKDMAAKLNEMMKVVLLQNSFIDFVPASKRLGADDLRLNYMRVYDALDNLYELNQDMASELDDIASELYRISEEVELQEEERKEAGA